MPATHKRKQIRDKIAALLTGATDCGGSVFTNRGRPFNPNELPSITVFAEEESTDFLIDPEPALRRTLTLYIDFAKMQTSHVDDEIDELCRQIEDVLKPKTALSGYYGNLIQSLTPTKTEISVFEKGEAVMGSARLTYLVEYDTGL